MTALPNDMAALLKFGFSAHEVDDEFAALENAVDWLQRRDNADVSNKVGVLKRLEGDPMEPIEAAARQLAPPKRLCLATTACSYSSPTRCERPRFYERPAAPVFSARMMVAVVALRRFSWEKHSMA